MRTLAVSDLHGDLASVHRALDRFAPGLLLCCGDWGDPGEVAEADLAAIVARVPVLTTFGNHDPLDLLPRLRNADGSPILIGQGEVRAVGGRKVAAIGGIWAKSHRLPHYVTDEDVARFAAAIASGGPVDVLLTHGCPSGVADLTPTGRHGGQRCFLDAFKAIRPQVHLCGHLHRPQAHTLKDGRQVINVGASPAGSAVVIEDDGAARLESF